MNLPRFSGMKLGAVIGNNFGAAKNAASRVNYTVHQGIRVSKFLSQAIIGNLALGRRPSKAQRDLLPPVGEVLKDLKNLFEKDYANVEAGIYRVSDDDLGRPLTFSRNTIRFFLDLVKVRQRQVGKNVVEAAEHKDAGDFPKYFTQNFHFQTDGYLSEQSADLYDHQVELVFGGGAEAMRRQALVPLYRHMQAVGTQKIELLDIACGTGRFLREVKSNYNDVRVTGVDLSPWYLKKARGLLKSETHVNFVEANAESLPFKDAQFDVVTSIFLFHELPRRVRDTVTAEMARVLKPGGKLIFVDSIQKGDKPVFDASIEYFPVNYYEPYYLDYIRDDLSATFAKHGLISEQVELAFFSKVFTLTKGETVTSAPIVAAKPRKKVAAAGRAPKVSASERLPKVAAAAAAALGAELPKKKKLKKTV